jgi:hypothetical protein
VSISEIGARNTAAVVLAALETAEETLSPAGTSQTRLFVATRAAQASLAYISFPTDSGRTRLRLRLEDLQLVESLGCLAGNLPVGGLMQRGLSLAIHIAQTTLAGVPASTEFVLEEARVIVRLASRIAA